MSSKNSSKNVKALARLAKARRDAKHGDFFFADWITSDGYQRKSPCLVVSDHPDPHDEIIILKITTDPGRTEFDIPVSGLKEASVIRTNKIYTIQRSQLLFPISKTLTTSEYKDVTDKLKKAQCL
jgi:hypothetical protein